MNSHDLETAKRHIAQRRVANTCSVCGDAIQSHGDGFHHDNGEKHDHEAKPSKESARRTAGDNDRPAGAAPMVDTVLDPGDEDVAMFEGEWVHQDTTSPDMPGDGSDPNGPFPINGSLEQVHGTADIDLFGGDLPKAEAAARKEAMPAPADLGVAVGDIFVNSWGYDQTNVDFYKVVRLTGAGVEVVPIGSKVIQANGPGGNQVVPDPDYIREYDVITGIQRGEGKKSKVCKLTTGYQGAPSIVLKSGEHWAQKWDGRPEYETDSMFGR